MPIEAHGMGGCIEPEVTYQSDSTEDKIKLGAFLSE